ncbi:AAA family ATPase [Corynebacterium atrinae]|uniref:AAA family ATPase n=1 Tax=Corynebacterium atrinae TaxID=1336740 RepID=UPI003F4942DB
MFITSARLDTPLEELPPYVAGLPVVQLLAAEGVDFDSPITIITGENGTGKSTFIEAIAVGSRLNPEGGSRHASFETMTDSVSPLHAAITLVRRRNPEDAFFLRGESFYQLASYYETLHPVPPRSTPMNDLRRMSHGQSLIATILRRFHGDGLFLLDEPEAGLSTLRQLELLGRLYHLAEAGSQIIMATHSPILLAIPDAQILELTPTGVRWVPFEETDAFAAAQEFASDPLGSAAFLTEEDA